MGQPNKYWLNESRGQERGLSWEDMLVSHLVGCRLWGWANFYLSTQIHSLILSDAGAGTPKTMSQALPVEGGWRSPHQPRFFTPAATVDSSSNCGVQ